ncbi:MAG: hypothetical protein ABI723_06055 [Bacteroidia bacterium]
MKNSNNEGILKRIKVRNIIPADYLNIVALQAKCFSGMKPCNEEQFENILKRLLGGQICVEYNGKVITSSCSLMVDSGKYSETSSWKELTDNGYINNYLSNGDTLYGMEIMVDPEYRNMKLARIKRNREYGTVQPWNDLRNDLYEVIQKHNESTESYPVKKRNGKQEKQQVSIINQ